MYNFIITQYKLYLAGNSNINIEKLDKLAKLYLTDEEMELYKQLKIGGQHL